MDMKYPDEQSVSNPNAFNEFQSENYDALFYQKNIIN